MAQPGGLLCSLICFDQLQGFYASRGGSPRSRVGPLAGQVPDSCTSCVQRCAAPIRHKLKGLCGTPTAFNIRAPLSVAPVQTTHCWGIVGFQTHPISEPQEQSVEAGLQVQGLARVNRWHHRFYKVDINMM